MMKKLDSINLLLLCSFWSIAGAVAALPEDRDQPINITSDRAERDEKVGVTIYIGEVELDQGSLSISADRLEIHMTGDIVTKMVATGIPARVRQLPNRQDGEIRARGNTIKYFLDEEKLELIDDASIEQNGSRLASDRIDYFINEEFVKARSTSGQNGRVHTVIPPGRANTAGIPANSAPQDATVTTAAPSILLTETPATTPVVTTPVATPPVATTPVATTPVVTPPVVTPPVVTPPVVTPPVVTTPVATPPVATPPVTTTPVATTPVATTPVTTTPVATTPIATTPTAATPGVTTSTTPIDPPAETDPVSAPTATAAQP